MTFTIQHTAVGESPFWHHLESHKSEYAAISRARDYVLDHGGYVCVKDAGGRTVFGTNPIDLDRAILNGINRHFSRKTA